MGQMASGITHDFSNALMPLIGLTEMLLTESEILADKDETLAILKQLAAAANDAKEVVSRLREFYKPNEDLRHTTLDINAIIQSTVLLTQPRWQAEMQAKGLSVSMKTNLTKIPSVAGNEFQIREALTNLVFNALDAMPEGGSLIINTYGNSDGVTIEVQDTGIGMDEETQARCFEAFYSTKGDRGTGLGLPMVRDIIKRHRGTVDVQSAVGQGTMFTIRLPAGTNDKKLEYQEQENPKLSVMRVLIVDDHVGAQDVLKKYLEIDKHQVDVANTGTEALQLLKKFTYDLVITDRAMPDVNGDIVAVASKSKNPPPQVIMLTGFGDIMLEKNEYPPGVDLILPKPVSLKELRFVLTELFQNQE